MFSPRIMALVKWKSDLDLAQSVALCRVSCSQGNIQFAVITSVFLAGSNSLYYSDDLKKDGLGFQTGSCKVIRLQLASRHFNTIVGIIYAWRLTLCRIQ